MLQLVEEQSLGCRFGPGRGCMLGGTQGLTFGLEEAKGPGSHGSCSIVSLRTPRLVSAQVLGLILEFSAPVTVWVFWSNGGKQAVRLGT